MKTIISENFELILKEKKILEKELSVKISSKDEQKIGNFLTNLPKRGQIKEETQTPLRVSRILI